MNKLAIAIAIALSVAVPSGALAASPSGGPERPSLRKELHRLVSAGAPGAILFVRVGEHELRLASGYGDVHSELRCGQATAFASRA